MTSLEGLQLASFYVAAISGLSAAGALWQNSKTQKTILIHSLHERFFAIQSEAVAHINNENRNRYNELLSNFFEYVSLLIYKKSIRLNDVQLMHQMMLDWWEKYGKGKKNSDQTITYRNWESVLLRIEKIRNSTEWH